MARKMWARAAAASVVAALVAGCGSGAEGPVGAATNVDAVESASASVSATASASPDVDSGGVPLTKDQLNEALLDQGDLKGYAVKELAVPEVDDVPVNASDDVCAAVVMMAMMFSVSGDSVARSTGRSVGPTSGKSLGTGISVMLSSYRAADGEQGIADLEASVAGCPDGVEVSDDFKVSDVESLESPDAGDGAVSFRLRGGIFGSDIPSAYTVARSGSTLAMFYAASLTEPEGITVPDEVVEAQMVKLEKVAG